MTKRTRNCNSKNHLLVTIFAALFAVLVPQQLAAYDFMVDGLCYNLTSGTTVEVTYQNYSQSSYTDLIIPETVTNNGTTYSVTSIGWNAFRGCRGMSSVTIPNSITSIGSSAFEGCSGLTSVSIPNSVTRIGNYAFTGCSGLESIKVASGNRVYDSRNDCNAIIETGTNTLIFGCKTSSIPNSVTSIGGSAFGSCSGLTSVTIPNSVTSIGWNAFYGCSGLTSVTIPNSVTSIGSSAFEGCSGLTSVTIGNSVEDIYRFAFKDCQNLNRVNISDLRTWCETKFEHLIRTEENTESTSEHHDSHTQNVTHSFCFDTLSYSSNPLFYAKHLYINGEEVTNLVIPEGTSKISAIAFVGYEALQSVLIPTSVTTVGRQAFSKCNNLQRVSISSLDSWMDIDFSREFDYICYECYAIEDIYYNEDGTESESSYFFEKYPTYDATWFEGSTNPLDISHHLYLNDIEIKQLAIPEAREEIKALTFINCEKISEIIIPKDIKSIDCGAFANCTDLRTITCYAQTPPLLVDTYTPSSINWPYGYQPNMKTNMVSYKKNNPHSVNGDESYYDECSHPFSGCLLDSITLKVPVAHITDYLTNSSWKELCKNIMPIEDITLLDEDVFVDGRVDVADVNATINVMIGNGTLDYTIKRSDVNGDGVVDIFDLNQIIGAMLGNGTVPEPVPHKIYTVNGVSFKMVAVEGGTFTMGATPEQGSDAYSSEKPAHQVTLSSYSIGQTEVTQELWQAVMGSNPSSFTGNLQRPVERVSWNDCQTFITKLNQMTGKNFRLPTEAEWEYAARGGNRSQSYKYAGSNTVEDVTWYSSNSGSTTHPVATKAPNELGLYDMSGNVYEWCQDWWGSYSSGAQTDPTGPSTGSYRVKRGGSWNDYGGNWRVSCRSNFTPSNTSSNLGLRLAL